jgi:hypothetical protein
VNGATNNASVGIGTTTPEFPLVVLENYDFGLAIDSLATGQAAWAVQGISATTQNQGIGGRFESDSVNGYGVEGVNTANGYAGYFQGGVGVIGNLGVDGSFGVQTDANIGGNLHVGGTLSKGAGSFKIDDPIDPAGKYLSHSFVESPDMMNIYNGSVVLDAQGRATIQMPKWFDALNQDFQYQLTAIGAPGPRLYVAREIHDNRFAIAGGKPGLKVSWQVTGVRHDAYANAHRIPTEEVKPPNEQGHYLHPELFGAGPEQGIGNAAVAANAPRATTNKDH